MSAAWNKASPDIACVCTGVLVCTDRLVPYRKQMPPTTLTHEELLAGGNLVGGSSNFSVRREVFISVGGHPPCRGAHDWAVLLRITKVGRMQVIPEALVLYRSPSTNRKPTYTKSFRKQIVAVSHIYRLHSKDEQSVMRPMVRLYVLHNVAQMGRRRMAFKLFLSVLSHTRQITPILLQSLFLILTSPRIYNRLLMNYALLRASFLGKRLLARECMTAMKLRSRTGLILEDG